MDKSQKKAKGRKKAVIKDLEEKDAEKVKGGVLSSSIKTTSAILFPKIESPTIQFPKVE